jgi:multidrug efflux pump subunit AcrA (membrane-fusion protein)
MMNNTSISALLFLSILTIPSCKNRETGQEIVVPPISARTTGIQEGKIEEYLLLNGKTTYLKKDKIVAPIPAYVIRVHVQHGDMVKEGDVLFALQTRENRALNNTTNILEVTAPAEGTVNEIVANQPGAYMMEGDLLCMLVENRDLLIQVNVPYEYNGLMKQGNSCRVLLPDETEFAASIATILPDINETDQTQTVLLKPVTPVAIPENLNLAIRFVLDSHNRSLLVPREAVMTNEKQTNFWIMKIAQDSIAVAVPVEKGIENDSLVEIISPDLKAGDLVITEGAFGLPDSSIVKLIK